MRHGNAKKKCKLSPMSKTMAAAAVDLAVAENRKDGKQAGFYLREQVGLQLTIITAFQYLTGVGAMAAGHALLGDWVGEEDLTKERAKHAMLLGNQFCADAHP